MNKLYKLNVNLGNGLYNLNKNTTKINYSCNRKNCQNSAHGNLMCKYCVGKCINPDCKTRPLTTNYCELHVTSGNFCNHLNCNNIKIKDQMFCFIHV